MLNQVLQYGLSLKHYIAHGGGKQASDVAAGELDSALFRYKSNT